MELVTSLYSFAYSMVYLFIICIYILLSPLCIISSSLFEWALQFAIDLDDQTVMLILILLTVWAISAYSIF